MRVYKQQIAKEKKRKNLFIKYSIVKMNLHVSYANVSDVEIVCREQSTST